MNDSKQKMISTVTFGCKVNQAEMDELIDELSHYNIEYTKDPNIADIVVVNTCAVTQKAQDDGVKYLKRLHRKNPNVTIIATGCLAELMQEKLLSSGVIKVVSNSQKSSIIDILGLSTASTEGVSEHDNDACSETLQHGDILIHDAPAERMDADINCHTNSSKAARYKHTSHDISSSNNISKGILSEPISKLRTRAFLKIQDGCDCFCTYCIIPHLRGAPSSKPMARVIDEVNTLIADGYKEIVLTGIHVGLYGADIGTTFKELLRKLIEIPAEYRVRFTSLYVDEIDEEFVNIVTSSNDKLCPHFHLSLQSASNDILTKMGRKYTVQDFISSVQMIRSKLPYANIGIDLIVGFPGEDEEIFMQSYNALNNLPTALMLDYMHIFPYSARPGTPAATMKKQVQQHEKIRRAKAMRQIVQKQKDERSKVNHGRQMRVLSEQSDKGHSDNYYLINLPKGTKDNQFISVTYLHKEQ